MIDVIVGLTIAGWVFCLLALFILLVYFIAEGDMFDNEDKREVARIFFAILGAALVPFLIVPGALAYGLYTAAYWAFWNEKKEKK